MASSGNTSTIVNSTEIDGMVNGRCYNPRAPLEGPPLFQNGDIKFQAHDVGWIVCAFFTIVACVTSLWLVNKHLQWYTNKKEQRYIVRLLFMVPIYALISFASFLFWNNSTPLLLLRDAYEAVLLTSFFYLLLTYLSPDPEEQKAILRKEGLSRQNDVERLRRGEQPKKWFFPLGFVKWKPADGLYFLQYMKWAVLQYCVVRPVTTLAAIVLNYIGLYCEESWSPGWGHIWITGIISISVSVAMYCLVQFYLSVAPYLVKQKPVLKMVSIKAVVFLTFWQASALSLLTMFDIVKDTPYMTAADINIGWGALLETLEMAIFAFVHVKAFSYKPYRPAARDAQRTPRLRALMHAMDFRETFRELRAGTVYMWHQMRGKETDVAARREAHLVGAFDKSRTDVWRDMHQREKGASDGEEMGVDVTVRVDRVVDVDVEGEGEGERQWLGVGDDYGYGVARRERSDALGVQIERELARRGVMERVNNVHDEHNPEPVDTRIQRSWWRGLYDRVSQSNPDDDDALAHPFIFKPKRHAKSKSKSRDEERKGLMYAYDDLPPPSALQTYRSSRRASQEMAARPPPPSDGMPTLFASIPEHDVHHAPHPSPLSPTRSDSLLGRVFPPSQPRTSEHGHATVTSASSHAHPDPAKPPPVTRYVNAGRAVELTVPQWLGDVGPPPPPSPSPASPPGGRGHAPPPHPPSTSALDEMDHRRRSSHRRESATHQGGPPPQPKSKSKSNSRSRADGQPSQLVSPTYTPSPPRTQYAPTRGSPSSPARGPPYGHPASPSSPPTTRGPAYGPPSSPSSPTRAQGPPCGHPASPPPLYGSPGPVYAAAMMPPPAPSYAPSSPSRRQSGDVYRQSGAQDPSRSRRER